MTTHRPEEITAAVRAHYGGRAEQLLAREQSAPTAEADACCEPECGATATDTAADGVAARYYAAADTAALPESVVSYGCGNPIAIAGLRAGEVVVDLGSGAGLDCFLSARAVGDSGHVIGLDMTDSMLELARLNQAKLGLSNVEFRKGQMEAMPLDDGSVDVIISNCVINLSPDKDAVFRESFRVLRPGGRLHVSDVVLVQPLTESEQGDMASWAGCVTGGLLREDYQARLERAGFAEVTIEITDTSERPWRSALISAHRPTTDGQIVRAAPATVTPTLITTIPLEVVSQDDACCGGGSATGCC